MSMMGSGCTFCGAAGPLVDSCVLDDKWSRSFGGDPVVALDHGWYTASNGTRVEAGERAAAKHFRPYLRALCDYCAHGWVEDVRWRAEPGLLALARGGEAPPSSRPALVRWARLTALLAEQLEGMPTAATSAQRAAVHADRLPAPPLDVWFFTHGQALPPRLHLSQVPAGASLVQVVSLDVGRLSALVVLPSDEDARTLVERSELTAAFAGDELAPRLDLTRTAHPHRVAVQRLCATSEGTTSSLSG